MGSFSAANAIEVREKDRAVEVNPREDLAQKAKRDTDVARNFMLFITRLTAMEWMNHMMLFEDFGSD